VQFQQVMNGGRYRCGDLNVPYPRYIQKLEFEVKVKQK
jgi:hypothetical protein